MRSKTRKNSSRSSISKNRKSRKNKSITPTAGEAIAAGGFGCVFRPPVKCKSNADAKRQAKGNYISKIMSNRHASDEMREVRKFLPVIKTIPNYKKYFLLDGIFSCDVGSFSESDKRNLNRKCSNLIRLGVKEENINKPNVISLIKSLNIPDGGVSIKNVMESMAVKVANDDSEQLKRFGHLNNSLIRTLKNAIVPMNNRGIIHCDLKADNMLVEEAKLSDGEPYVKVIDWGLGDLVKSNTHIPEAVKNRPIQFNAPWGVILFADGDVAYAISQLRITHPGENIYRALAYTIIQNSNRSSPGHTQYLLSYLLPDLVTPFMNLSNTQAPNGFPGSSRTINDTIFGGSILVTHIEKVLERFYNVKTGRFDKLAYFQEVYKYNVDVWGFIMSYIELLTTAANNSYTRFRNSKVLQKIASILYKYCFSGDYAANIIPVSVLESELQEVSNMIPGFKSKGIVEDSPSPAAAAAAKAVAKKPKKANKKIKLKAKSPSPPKGTLISIPAGKKRCPNGYAKDKATGKCRKKGTKVSSKKNKNKRKEKTRKLAKKPKKANKTKKSPNSLPLRVTLPLGRKRCPKGYHNIGLGDGVNTRIICQKNNI